MNVPVKGFIKSAPCRVMVSLCMLAPLPSDTLCDTPWMTSVNNTNNHCKGTNNHNCKGPVHKHLLLAWCAKLFLDLSALVVCLKLAAIQLPALTS